MLYVLLLEDGTCCALEGTRILFVPHTVTRGNIGDWVEKNQRHSIPLNIVDDPVLVEDEGDLLLGSVFNEDDSSPKSSHIEHIYEEM